jgi:hypothetical protein
MSSDSDNRIQRWTGVGEQQAHRVQFSSAVTSSPIVYTPQYCSSEITVRDHWFDISSVEGHAVVGGGHPVAIEELGLISHRRYASGSIPERPFEWLARLCCFGEKPWSGILILHGAESLESATTVQSATYSRARHA